MRKRSTWRRGRGGNAAENNYLSHWQKDAYSKELANCKDEFCRMGTHLRWLGTSVNQDAALVTGMALGLGIEVVDAAAALTELPQTIEMLANNPELLMTLPEGYLQDLQTTYTEYQVALETAGVDGATAAGVKFTHMLGQLAMLPAAAATAGVAAGYTGTKVAGLLDKLGGAGRAVEVDLPVTSGGAANSATANGLAHDLMVAQSQDPLIGTKLPGGKAPVSVTAESNIGGQTIFDTNQTARPTALANNEQLTLISDLLPPGSPNTTMANAHAEIGVIQQAFDAGLTQRQSMTIVVRGQSVCSYCQSDLMSMANRAGLSSLIVVDGATGAISQWSRGTVGWMLMRGN